MSLPEQEARALEQARRFLLDLGSGVMPVTGHVSELRKEARAILRHYPLLAGPDWLSAHGWSPEEIENSSV